MNQIKLHTQMVKTFLVFMFFSLTVGCASLLPPERRVYPKNPIPLPNGMDIHDWMDTKKKQFPDHLRSNSPYGKVYKIMYFRKEKTFLGSYISCSAYIRQIDTKSIELVELATLINYSDYTKSIGRYNKGGDLGPMSEKERTEILLPCIEEFLTPPN
ncbi:hypothetical protein AB3N60_03400 [Leptospira sp. WS39.C2]